MHREASARSAFRSPRPSGRGHRCLQHRKDRPGPLDRRRPRHRLHPRRLRGRLRALRPHPRHRRQLAAVTAPTRTHPDRNARHRRRRRRRPLDRRLRPPAAGCCPFTVRASAAHHQDPERTPRRPRASRALIEADKLTPIIDKTYPLHRRPTLCVTSKRATLAENS